MRLWKFALGHASEKRSAFVDEYVFSNNRYLYDNIVAF